MARRAVVITLGAILIASALNLLALSLLRSGEHVFQEASVAPNASSTAVTTPNGNNDERSVPEATSPGSTGTTIAPVLTRYTIGASIAASLVAIFFLMREQRSTHEPAPRTASRQVGDVFVEEPPEVSIHSSRPNTRQPGGALDISPPMSVAMPDASQLTLNTSNTPLDNKPWLGLVEECVELFDEVDRYRDGLVLPSHELADHLCAQLRDILQRADVTIIGDDSTFDRQRHQPEPRDANVVPGAAIAETLSPGFAVDRRVLRRARVRLATSVSAKGV